MGNSRKPLCTRCQARTVEFLVSFSGAASCTPIDVCRYDRETFPNSVSCAFFEPTLAQALAHRRSIPIAPDRIPTAHASAGGHAPTYMREENGY